jgi:hypothetical protein
VTKEDILANKNICCPFALCLCRFVLLIVHNKIYLYFILFYNIREYRGSFQYFHRSSKKKEEANALSVGLFPARAAPTGIAGFPG